MWSRHCRRIEPINLSIYAFCHGDRGAIGRSRIPMARRRCTKTGQYEVSRSRMRYRGALSHGNASVIWREIHSAVGFSVTANDSKSRRSWRRMTRQYKTIEGLECNRRQDEEVNCGDAVDVILEKRPPALGWRPRTTAHIPGDRRLGHIEAKLEQLTVNVWRAPKWVRTAHLANELAQFGRGLRSANTIV